MDKGTSLDEMEITYRTYNCLRREGFQTVGDILNLSAAELLRIPNFGRKSLNELNAVFAPHGLVITGESTSKPIRLILRSNIYSKLAERALDNRRSVEAEAVALLSRALGDDRGGMTLVDRIEALERAVFPKEPSQ